MSGRVEFPPRIFVPEDRFGADLSMAAAVPQVASDNQEYLRQDCVDLLEKKLDEAVEVLAELYKLASPITTCEVDYCKYCVPRRPLEERVQKLLREAGKL